MWTICLSICRFLAGQIKKSRDWEKFLLDGRVSCLITFCSPPVFDLAIPISAPRQRFPRLQLGIISFPAKRSSHGPTASATATMSLPLITIGVLALSVASTTMASAGPPASTTIEHVLLFEMKPEAVPSRLDAIISNMRGLDSLDPVSYITAVRILRTQSPAAAPFSLLLHGRYASKADLAAYSSDPRHVATVKDSSPLISSLLAVDWVANLDSGPLVPPLGSAVRLTLVKLKQGVGEEDKGAVLGAMKDSFVHAGVEVLQVSSGENFSPGRARGYSLAVLAVFPEVKQLDELDGKVTGSKEGIPNENVRPFIESAIVVDFVVPPS